MQETSQVRFEPQVASGRNIGLVFIFGYLLHWLAGAATYGGLVGRTWNFASFSEAILAIPRLSASNLAGLEEEV